MVKGVFSVGQVAKICQVSRGTVKKWIDSGLLLVYRVPGSRHPRVSREFLIRFLKENGMTSLEEGVPR